MRPGRSDRGRAGGAFLAAVASLAVGAIAAPPSPERKPPPDGYSRIYAGYRPSFLALARRRRYSRGPLAVDAETMRLSGERDFFTLNLLDERSRACAIIEAARKRQGEGQTREAMKLYQLAVERHPHALFRISDAGVFVTVSQYCQRRILALPPADLAFYRTMYDARAREAFEQARRRYSLVGLQEIVDTMLATSWGDNALAVLGDSALDVGDYEEALQRYETIRTLLAGSDSDTAELEMKRRLCLKKLGRPSGRARAGPAGRDALPAEQLARLKALLDRTGPDGLPPDQQRACPPHLSASDYVRFEPVTDEMALDEPVWSVPLPGGRGDYYVLTQPVVAGDSVLYRHKNIVTCRSLLNGEPRWTCDLGGRVSWQNPDERMYPAEEMVVMDGTAYTSLFKAGPSLVALDLTTGQLRWASGPMAPATRDDTRMRYEAAPAVAPGAVYAGYVKDNIEGDTHTDTAYGLRAFDAASGRGLWETPICRLAPGRFSGGVAVTRRNRIRSFTSPPVLHQGILYYNTNAGAVAAVNARSGRIEWVMRYPYWPTVHDATRPFGARPWQLAGPHRLLRPAGWLNQRPLVLADKVIVAPVDSPCLMGIERATGKVVWTYARTGGAHAYVLGPIRSGELVLAFSGRAGSVKLLDPATGKITWQSPDPIRPEASPGMTASRKGVLRNVPILATIDIQNPDAHPFWLGARPLLTSDDHLHVTSFDYVRPDSLAPGGWVYNLASFSLTGRRLRRQRIYYDAGVRARAEKLIRVQAPEALKASAPGPQRELLEAIAADQVPENAHGPFRPFSRMTFTRYGTRFELRTSTRTLSMCYDRPAVARALSSAAGGRADFARAELAVAASRFARAAELLAKCLREASPNDTDFRSAVNQQLYRVRLSLSRTAIRQARPADQLASAMDLYCRANTADEETLALFALAEAYRRSGDPARAARCLQSIVRHYARRPHRVPALAQHDPQAIARAASGALDAAAGKVHRDFFAEPAARGIDLLRASVPLWGSAVSTLPRTVTLEAGPLATRRLLELTGRHGGFARTFARQAAQALARAGPDERLTVIRQFPGTPAAAEALAALLAEAGRATGLARRRRLWRLAETAALAAAPIPQARRAGMHFDAAPHKPRPLAGPMKDLAVDFTDPAGGLRMVLPRRGQRRTRPELVFVGGRAKKRLDNKFEVACVDGPTGRKLWGTANIRLKDRGQESGFAEAFVFGPVVVVHGLYDVLALSLADGAVRWHYRAPFDFEIAHATAVGDLLILSGPSQTVALYAPTASAAGEVAWAVAEAGKPYARPGVLGERLVSLRQLPSALTVRRIGTGRLIGHLELPDLLGLTEHPLIDGGPEALPVARSGDRLFVTDGWYYIALDTRRPRVLWKRRIAANDPTRQPPIRLAAGADVLLALKKDYQTPAMIALDAATGGLLWRTDPESAGKAQPMYSAVVAGGRAYGLTSGVGRSFTVHAVEARTGRPAAAWSSGEAYQARPTARLLRQTFGGALVACVQDGQSFELIALDGKTCRPLHKLTCRGVGPWGTPGRISAAVQAGNLLLMNTDRLLIARPRGG